MATGRYKEEIRGNSKSRFTNHKETSQNSTHSINNSGPSRFRRKDRALRARSRGRFRWPVLGALPKGHTPTRRGQRTLQGAERGVRAPAGRAAVALGSASGRGGRAGSGTSAPCDVFGRKIFAATFS